MLLPPLQFLMLLGCMCVRLGHTLPGHRRVCTPMQGQKSSEGSDWTLRSVWGLDFSEAGALCIGPMQSRSESAHSFSCPGSRLKSRSCLCSEDICFGLRGTLPKCGLDIFAPLRFWDAFSIKSVHAKTYTVGRLQRACFSGCETPLGRKPLYTC